MPRQILPYLGKLLNQIEGIISTYQHQLDDDFLFGSAAQIPQIATVFDRIGDRLLRFGGEALSLAELLTLIAYRYGFDQVKVVGHGGYAIVLGHAQPTQLHQRRVLRLVPDHHVRDIVAHNGKVHPFDVQLDDQREPIRDPHYPLILSDLFLMPRHTTRLIFREPDGSIMQAGGYPAIMHCQLLPEVRVFNSPTLDRGLAQAGGELLEAALATLGVQVADAHGGNGGVLVGNDGKPIIQHTGTQPHYIPVVLDYGYYAQIGPRRLATLLHRHGITPDRIQQIYPTIETDCEAGQSWEVCLREIIGQRDLPPGSFGQLLHHSKPQWIDPNIWIDLADHQWKTAKEKTYPPLQAQSRLARLYPNFDEVIFPQRIEEYSFTL